MDFKTYYLKTYAAWLGKIIGIRLGAPVENWSHEDIKKTYGTIDNYVVDYGTFSADDDSNGPLFFVRVLDKYLKDLDVEKMGEHMLSVLSDGHGFFWWGGDGIATEHTAYLRLKEGYKAPKSGSKEVNGDVLCNQIGGQIFSDCWGYVSMGNPKLASDLAQNMASVTHDEEGIIGARFIAAAIALAYKSNDIKDVINKALEYIDNDSLYYKLVKELIDLYDSGLRQDEALDYIFKNHGYDKYAGVCHILPNTALMIWAMLYGENDFSKTLCILCEAGYDTDCNCGNVGSIMGALKGIDNIDSKWIKPINDLLISSSFLGSENIDTVSDTALRFANYGALLNNIEIDEYYKRQLAFDEQVFIFDLPYATKAFRVDTNRYFESSLKVENNSLKCIISKMYSGFKGHLYQKTYYLNEDLYDARYEPTFSGKVYPGETITFKLSSEEALNIKLRIYAKGRDKTYYGDYFTINKDIESHSFKIEPSSDLILEYGLELVSEEIIIHSFINIHEVIVDRKFNYQIDFSKEYMEDRGLNFGGLPFKEISQCTTMKQRAYIDKGVLKISDDFVLFSDIRAKIKKLKMHFSFKNKIRICLGVSDALNYDALEISDNEVLIIQKRGKEEKIVKKMLKKPLNKERIELNIDWNYGLIMVLDDNEMRALSISRNGAVGIIVDKDSYAEIYDCLLVA